MEQLLFNKDGAVAELTFNNPERRNAMTLAMWGGLSDHLSAMAEDRDMRVLILTGAGDRAFVSGADISEFDALRSTAEGVENYNQISRKAEADLDSFIKPTLAKIRGYCVGGGVGLATACDIRLASQSAKFALPAGKLGLGYGYAGAKKLIELMGPAKAAEFFYTGRLFSADEALALGLINRVVADSELDDAVAELAAMIAANAPLTLQAFKAVKTELQKPALNQDVDRLNEMSAACFQSDDYAEGRKAFAEKRKPAFKGV